MNSSRSVLLLLASVCLTLAAASTFHDDYKDFKHFKNILSKPRMLDRHRYSNRVLYEKGMVQGLTWKNCGSSSDPLQAKSLSINPEPVKVPGNVTISGKATTSIDLTTPIQVSLTVKKKVLFWIEIPCIDNIGSCDYADVCTLLETVNPCPPELVKIGINCQCPINKGLYSLPSMDVAIPAVGLPDWLKDGDYEVTAKASSNGQPIGCLFIQLSLTEGKVKVKV